VNVARTFDLGQQCRCREPHFQERRDSLVQCGCLSIVSEAKHHEAEIGEQLAGWSEGRVSCRLLAHAGPFVRGIHATVHARLRRPVPDPLALYRQAYEGRPFVHVEDTPPGLHAVVGTNFAHLHAVPREDGREVVVTAVVDNLLKGAAGQAVQAMNLALGLDERAGLTWPGVHPC